MTGYHCPRGMAGHLPTVVSTVTTTTYVDALPKVHYNGKKCPHSTTNFICAQPSLTLTPQNDHIFTYTFDDLTFFLWKTLAMQYQNHKARKTIVMGPEKEPICFVRVIS